MPSILRKDGDITNPIMTRPFGYHATNGLPCYAAKIGARVGGVWLLHKGPGHRVVKVYYGEGHELPEFDSAGNRIWQYFPGIVPTSWTDVRAKSTLFPTLNHLFRGKARIDVLLPEYLSEDVEEPGKLTVYLETCLVWDFEIVNNELVLTEQTYSPNNARVMLTALLEDGHVSLARFHRWAETWVEYKQLCAGQIAWATSPTETVMIDRFDAHVAYSQRTNLAAACEMVLRRSPGVAWQLVNGGIRVLTDQDRTSVHRFRWAEIGLEPPNIVDPVLELTPRPLADKPNFLSFDYRDLDHPFLGREGRPNYVQLDLPDLRRAQGGRLVTLNQSLGVMRQSLAQRIAAHEARLIEGGAYTPVRAFADSHHVAKSDIVEAEVVIAEDTPPQVREFVVADERFLSSKSSADEKQFTLCLRVPDAYRDTDHSFRQEIISSEVSDPYQPPGAPRELATQFAGAGTVLTWQRPLRSTVVAYEVRVGAGRDAEGALTGVLTDYNPRVVEATTVTLALGSGSYFIDVRARNNFGIGDAATLDFTATANGSGNTAVPTFTASVAPQVTSVSEQWRLLLTYPDINSRGALDFQVEVHKSADNSLVQTVPFGVNVRGDITQQAFDCTVRYRVRNDYRGTTAAPSDGWSAWSPSAPAYPAGSSGGTTPGDGEVEPIDPDPYDRWRVQPI